LTEPGLFKAEITNDIPAKTLRMMYETMQRIRKFEERVAELVSKNEIICPCHLYIGEEAVATGVCAALRKDDYVFSTHRSHGHYIAKGGDIKALMAELYCRATGCSKGRGGSMHLASPDVGLPGSSAIVAGTIPLAVGAALAFSLLPNLKLPIPPQSDNKFFDIYQNYVVQSKERDKLVACLRESCIEILILWHKPMHKHESLGLGYFHLPKTEQISTEVLSLQMYPEKHQLLRRKLK